MGETEINHKLRYKYTEIRAMGVKMFNVNEYIPVTFSKIFKILKMHILMTITKLYASSLLKGSSWYSLAF